ncbi:2,3-diaminopropionate biosynthesis protein SbnA [Streptomyces acidicola]|uniref:2,3-diaminopropionate biosynthesis protein SbnA n=1 Tax=Streptomyces acidicola TaxID=2596892 RepID=UPI0037F23807
MPPTDSVAIEDVRSSILDCVGNTPLVSLNRLFPDPEIEVLAKLELMNPGGSMKDRPAQFIMERGLADGSIPANAHIIESSSGNFGIALAIAAQLFGISFTCVVDPKTTQANVLLLRSLGANVEIVNTVDESGGYLHTRLRRVRELVASTPNSLWINQYANERNWLAHYHGSGTEISQQLIRPPDFFFAAVSTSGSILGCSRKLRESFPSVRVIAVDAVGSVIFGTPPGRREIPGIGSSRVPELLQRDEIDEVVHVDDVDAALACRELLATEGIFAGGSTGSVVAAMRKRLKDHPRPCRAVALFPDRGDRYMDLIYDDTWLNKQRDLRSGL